MYQPSWFVPYDVVILLVITVVSMAIAVFSLRGYRWIKERSLYFLFLAFALLAIGFFANGVTEGIDYIGHIRTVPGALQITDVGIWVYYVCSVLAFLILVVAYFRNVREVAMAPAVVAASTVTASTVAPIMEVVIIILLFTVVLAQVLHLSVRRSRSSIVVSLTFVVLLVSHIFIVASSARIADLYPVGMAIELVAFFLLLGLVLMVRRPG
jgi:hypothetical protein